MLINCPGLHSIQIWNKKETAYVVVQCRLRFCSQCFSDWHDNKTCDENMMAIHGQIDGLVFTLLCVLHFLGYPWSIYYAGSALLCLKIFCNYCFFDIISYRYFVILCSYTCIIVIIIIILYYAKWQHIHIIYNLIRSVN